MRWVVVVAFLLITSLAQAQPVRVALECQTAGRTKMCPSFLQGFIEASPVLKLSPRADADVLVYVNATSVALADHVHLRFVGSIPNAPKLVEVEGDLDTRGTDDEQRAQLQPLFLRGLALFVGARHPESVKVELSAPADKEVAKDGGSPWGFGIEVNSSGSYTENFRSASLFSVLALRYTERMFRAGSFTFLEGGFDRQPALTAADGTKISLDSENWKLRSGIEVVYAWNECWSLGVGSYWAVSDRKAQYRYDGRTRAAVAWNMFPEDDPRGNRLEVFYHLGWHVEKYNLRNDLDETFAQYPAHGINANGSVRRDKITYGVNLESDVQLNRPGRRYNVTASPYITIQLGKHVDLSLSGSLTNRELPAPDPDAIDMADFDLLSRLSYAEPLSLSGSIGLSIHFDPTNGIRNNRIKSI